jgi:hypothetical protein
MNERIRQLVRQAGLDNADFPIEDWDNVPLAKFAELIVRECAEIADTERSNSVGCGYITKTNGMRIKEYFGVKE